jgi:hypothetical protein
MRRLTFLVGLALAAVSSAAAAQVQRRNVATLPFTDGVIAVDAHSDGSLVIGAAHGDSTIAIALPAFAVAQWADSTARLIARRVPKSRRAHVYQSAVDNHETGAGISFTRHVVGDTSVYRLFFADTTYGGFPFTLSRREAQLFMDALRRGVKVVRAMTKPPAKRRSPPRSSATDSSRSRDRL